MESTEADSKPRPMQRVVHSQLDPSNHAGGLSPVNAVLLLVILSAVALAALETEATLQRSWSGFFQFAEEAFGSLFLVEYLVRLWIAPLDEPDQPAWKARLDFVISVSSVFDLIAIVASFLTPSGLSPFTLRVLRLTRILRLAKLARLSKAMAYFTRAIAARRDELFFSFVIGLVFLVISATMLYLVEGPIQPDKFGSVPRALWWAVATLTTIGYGDVYPVTPLGKLCAGVSAVIGIGLVAIPTGIMAAAFTDAQRQHEEERRIARISKPLTE